jgi:hypothetical protein
VACGKPCLICGKLWIGCGNSCGMFGENLAEKIRITNFIFRLIRLYLYIIGNQESRIAKLTIKIIAEP